MIHIEPLRIFDPEYIAAETEKRIDEQGVGYTEVRNVWILTWLSEEFLLPILERYFDISRPHPHFHKWELRRKNSIYFSIVYPFVYPKQDRMQARFVSI
jgi:hypothetical protein